MDKAGGHYRVMIKSIRHLAADILNRVEKSKAFAETLLDEQLEASKLSGSADGRLLTHLVYGVLRHRGHLDWILSKLHRGNWNREEEIIKNILRVGLFQLKFSDRLPAFAVVDEAVKIAKKLHTSRGNLVNALLRTYLREEKNISFPSTEKKPSEYIAAFHSHPLWLVKNMVKRFGAQSAEAICAANNDLPTLTIRVNTLKISRDALQEKLAQAGFSSMPATYSPDGLVLTSAVAPLQKTNLFLEGYLRLQDEASQLVSYLAGQQIGLSFLDACAGSGGKTTHLAAITKNTGHILAVDCDRQKIEQLKIEAARLGATNIQTLCADLQESLPEKLKLSFDAVWVDAPCSGLGTLRRHPEIKWRISSPALENIIRKQKTILQNASLAVCAGGLLIYSTCSILPEENEEVVESFMSSNPNFSLCPPSPALSVQLTGSGSFFRTFPHRHGIDGFFGAVLKRK